MKRIIQLLLFFLLSVTCVFSQVDQSNYYVVYLKDKGPGDNQHNNARFYLSALSVERRDKQHIAFDNTDLPVFQAYKQQINATGAPIVLESRWFNYLVVQPPATGIAALQNLPFVLKIEPVSKTYRSFNPSIGDKFSVETHPNSVLKSYPNEAYGAAFAQINQLHGQYMHQRGYMGQNMVIAVLDAGFNSADRLECFDSLRAQGGIMGTRDFVKPGNNVYDASMAWHGTHVLSTMAANVPQKMIGTAPHARYWLLRSEDAAGEYIMEEYYWVAAAEFADSVGVNLINSSLGYTTFDNTADSHTYAQMNGKTAIVTQAAVMAARKGILVVNSAGNEGSKTWKYIGAPADADSIITVGAVDETGKYASFSSIGPTADGRIKPTVVAMGQKATIYTPQGVVQSNGTSFSSPILCGMAACLWQAFPFKTNIQIIEMIKASANQANNPDSFLGYGIPDFYKIIIENNPLSSIKKEKITIIPNPLYNHAFLYAAEPLNGKVEINLFNIIGQKVLSDVLMVDGRQILSLNGVGELPSGMYLVQLVTEKGIITSKMVKSR